MLVVDDEQGWIVHRSDERRRLIRRVQQRVRRTLLQVYTAEMTVARSLLSDSKYSGTVLADDDTMC